MDCNILLLGQTGVGKSTLLNYLAGKDLAEAGIPLEIGGMTRGIHRYPVKINGKQCLVSDSEGFELSNLRYWERLIKKELSASSQGIGGWYHIVLFCIGANGARVQDFELKFLKKILKSGYAVVVALTKTDMASEDDVCSMKQVLNRSFKGTSQVFVVEVCSDKSSPMGKKALSDAIMKSWCKSLVNRLPENVFAPAFSSLESWHRLVEGWIEERNMGIFGKRKEDVYEELKTMVIGKQGTLSNSLKKRMDDSYSDIKNVFDSLNMVLGIGMDKLNRLSSPKKIKMPSSAVVFTDGFGSTLIDNLFGGIRRKELQASFRYVYSSLVREYERLQKAYAKELEKSVKALFPDE